MFESLSRLHQQEDQVHRVMFKILIWVGGIIGGLLLIGASVPALLIHVDETATADAAIVLQGPHYDARVFAAGTLYQQGRVKRIVLNGDRRSALVEKALAGSIPDYAPWDSRFLAILSAQGVPITAIESHSLPDAIDTRTEALLVAERVAHQSFQSLMIVTDQYHTGRARQIWQSRLGDRYQIYSHGSQLEGDNPDSWWERPHEIKRVLVEFGGYLFALVA